MSYPSCPHSPAPTLDVAFPKWSWASRRLRSPMSPCRGGGDSPRPASLFGLTTSPTELSLGLELFCFPSSRGEGRRANELLRNTCSNSRFYTATWVCRDCFQEDLVGGPFPCPDKWNCGCGRACPTSTLASLSADMSKLNAFVSPSFTTARPRPEKQPCGWHTLNGGPHKWVLIYVKTLRAVFQVPVNTSPKWSVSKPTFKKGTERF